ncbi:hypothetical protein LSCM1_08006 [Leishmania martiniquensis]|uniref:Protein NO VEIN C-terminal domain-containing protein n=1 Tax=Leishmania martiniquensis TaxID=1580590 RepID=A0A836HMC1_9TRYP|nr:hypothetical protein LSCM1_08006 [Leishmania martiniquensis]
MQAVDNGAQLQMLLRVNTYVQEQRQRYMALSLEEQRRRGPLLLEDLLTSVMNYLLEEAEGREEDDEGDIGRDVQGSGQHTVAQRSQRRVRAASGVRSVAARISLTNSLPFALRDVPALANVAALQLRLTSTVMAAISTRAIVTVHELEGWICAQEGVEHFAELGLGVGLQVLPVVQEYFQLRANSVVYPVRARDVIAFLLSDAAARDVLLYGGGDARDLLYRFSVFYERHVLESASPSSALATVRRQGRLLNVRQLGIHVQDYAALLASLTQELAGAHRLEQQICQGWLESCAAAANPITQGIASRDTAEGAEESSCGAGGGALVRDASFEGAARRERNRALYEHVLQSLDSACAQAGLVDGMRRIRENAVCARLGSSRDAVQRGTSVGARALTFVVTATEAEARSYSLPLSLWRTVPLDGGAGSALAGGQNGGGGVELRFQVGELVATEASRAAHRCTQGSTALAAVSGEPHAPGQRTSGGTHEVSPPSSVARRRRGTVVTDMPSAVSVGASAAAAAATEMRRPVSPSIASALASKAPLNSSATAASASSLLGSLLAPAGSLGLAAMSSGNIAREPASVHPQIGATTVGSVPSVEGAPSTTGVLLSALKAGAEPATALERLGDFLFQFRQSGAEKTRQGAPATAQCMASSTDNSWLDLAVAVFETFAVGDVVPVELVCEAWAACEASQGPAPPSLPPHSTNARGPLPARYAHRRCIPLFHPFMTSLDNGNSTVHLSPLASMRQQLRTRGTSGTSSAAHAASGAGDTAASATKEIVHMATPVEVCWLSWSGPAPPDGHGSREASILTCACLDRHYPPSLRGVFCRLLGVRAEPTVAAWCTAAAACARRLCPAVALTPSFTDAYVKSFVRCVDADVAARVKEAREQEAAVALLPDSASAAPSFLQQQQRTAQAALRMVLASLQESLTAVSPWRAGLFPCDHAWRCGLDGLLYATPQWCGYRGVLLAAPSASSPPNTTVSRPLSHGGSVSGAVAPPPLRVLCFSAQEPSWAVCAVLHYFGIRPLAQLAETRVSFSTAVATDAGGLLHDKIAAIVPYVQAFCRASFPLWYGVAYAQLRERLRRLRVILTATAGTSMVAASVSPVQTSRLDLNGHMYTHARQIQLAYVAAHNIIYGVAEAASVPMLAEALLPLFIPVGMSAEDDARQLRDVITRLLGALSSLDSSAEWCVGADTSLQQQQWRREQVEHVLRPVAMRYGLAAFNGLSCTAPLPSSHVSSTVATSARSADAEEGEEEASFTLSSRSSMRYMPNYPPGTDALRQPRDSQRAHMRQQSGQAAGTQANALDLVAHVRASSPRAASAARAGGGLVQRYGANGRLSINLTLGGSTVAVTSMPAWRDFPMELDLDAIVAASVACAASDSGSRGGDAPAKVRAREHEDTDDDGSSATSGIDGDGGSSTAAGGGEDEGAESFLTFQYHRRSDTASGALRRSGSRAESRKRLRAGNSETARYESGRPHHDSSGRDVRTAAMWLRPPAASAVAGTGGDTPDYAIAAERYVYERLQEEYAKEAQQSGVRVIWVNEGREAGSPFDLLVVKPRRLDSRHNSHNSVHGGWDVVQYVEVKSTCTANRQDFELSMAELLFAARFGAAYCVYRVFGASTDALRRMRHRVYTDLVHLWYTAQLTITSDIRVTPST